MKYFKKVGKIKIKTIDNPKKEEVSKLEKNGWVECDFHGHSLKEKTKLKKVKSEEEA